MTVGLAMYLLALRVSSHSLILSSPSRLRQEKHNRNGLGLSNSDQLYRNSHSNHHLTLDTSILRICYHVPIIASIRLSEHSGANAPTLYLPFLISAIITCFIVNVRV